MSFNEITSFLFGQKEYKSVGDVEGAVRIQLHPYIYIYIYIYIFRFILNLEISKLYFLLVVPIVAFGLCRLSEKTTNTVLFRLHV